ncbi:MAG: SPOR domain-containing protein [Nitrospinae bacterium]|nr:SPOR domain-containing protein [Nitrospinota bacterium]
MTPVPENSFQNKLRFYILLFTIVLIFAGVCIGYAADSKANNGWVVQLGSFKKVENAKGYIKKIKKKGYTPFMVSDEKSNWHKIRVGPYPSKDEADQVVLDLKKAQGITAIVLVSEGGQPDLEEPTDSVDVVVSQFLIWLNAWKAQEINSYLSFYSENFEDSKRSRESWEAQRRKTLSKSSIISIEVSDVQITQEEDAVEMSFTQNYKSDRISDVGKKVLIWRNEGDSWKIVKESWESS